MNASIATEAEEYVRDLARELLAPQPHECLACYLDRVLHVAGCDGTQRLSVAFRDAVAPRAYAVERRLADRGGYCDCEVLLNVYWSTSDDVHPCRGVRLGSTQPCTLWTTPRRW